MARRKSLTDRQVEKLPIKAKRYFFRDPELNGHYVRVMPSGVKSYAAVARDPYGKQIWFTVGNTDLLKIEDARDLARDAIKRIKKGLPPKEPTPEKPDSYKAVSDNWLKRVVAKKKLITEPEIRRVLDKYVLPKWGDKHFTAIKRSEVSALLDDIEDQHGARMADVVLSTMRGIADWHIQRDDEYKSPFVRGMRRSTAKPRARKLDHDEIRKMWKVAGDVGTHGALAKMLLLTAQRDKAVRHMRWSELSESRDAKTGAKVLTWTIPKAERQKGKPGSLRLPALAKAIIDKQPRLEGNSHVFASGRTGGPIARQSKVQKLTALPRWTPHDLRRTARSLMSEAGVSRDDAERVMGHALRGVEGTYDRFDYPEEKAHALAALAKLVEEILHGSPAKVVSIRRKAKAS